MKKSILFSVLALLCLFFKANAQTHYLLKGRVTDSVTNNSLYGATIKTKLNEGPAVTNNRGEFSLNVMKPSGILIVSYIGFQTIEVPYTSAGTDEVVIRLSESKSTLKEVTIVSNGYQTLPKEQVTGSIDQIDNALINRSTDPNILNRLNGITSGLRFNGLASNTVATGSGDRYLGINIRGVSTLNGNVSTDPLIVLDNFPYEGNISNINPNDIESITILKDAAAASIWGARSGNGVIVINTKKGRRYQKMTVDINSNVTVQNKSNLFYDRNFLNANDYINVESNLFKQGYFDSYLSDTQDAPPVSPVVDILSNQRNGVLSAADATAQINALRNNDVRNDYEKYIYRKAIQQQYSVGLRGGTNQNTYSLSIGYDNDQNGLVRNNFSRVTINALNTYSPIKNLEITTGINYSQNKTGLNNTLYYGNGISVGQPVAGIYPYAQFADANGGHLAVVKNYSSDYVNSAVGNGFLDWHYRPLDELNLADNYTKVNDLVLKADVKYKFASFLNAQVQYQNENQSVKNNRYQSKDTYAARDLINQFTIITPGASPTYQVPVGGILDLGDYNLLSNNFRGQLNFNQNFNEKNNISAIVGTEIRQLKNTGYTRRSYGYDDQFGTSNNALDFYDYFVTNPNGYSQIPTPDGTVTGTTNRFVSYFANAAYTYDSRYTLTLSGRKDGANIFGVKTNDKVTPLWSAGIGWDVYKESFYKVSWLPYLKARLSYGYNGNVYNGSAYVTGNYTTSPITGAPTILNLTAPNPNLSWEKVKNINAGIDFETKNRVLSGSIEYYVKSGRDLIENVPLATSTGFLSFYGNAASTSTKGFDVTLNSKNLNGTFKWSTTVLFSTLKDKVEEFNVNYDNTTLPGSQSGGFPAIGKSLYGIYSYKWAGLDPANGDPQGYLNGKISKDYTGILANFNPDSVKYNGSARPAIYGSIRNDLGYKNFSLSVNISYEFGYVFRRSSTSINYADIISSPYSQNIDYSQRWQQLGDEKLTNVPSVIYPSNVNRNTFYQYSSALVGNAANVRLQDIRLSYELTKANWKGLPFSSLQLYTYASNLGIIWRANKYGIDPDISTISSHGYPNPFMIAFGFSAHF